MRRMGTVLIAAAAIVGLATKAEEADVRERGIARQGIANDGTVRGELKNLLKLDKATSIHYTILLTQPDGTAKPVREEAGFKIGQQFRVEIEADRDLYIYVFHEGPKGERTILLPDAGDKGRIPMVKKGQKKVLPDDGTYFEFVPPAGTERLLVYASPTPQPSLTPAEVFEKDAGKELKSTQDKAFKSASSAKSETIEGANIADAAKAFETKPDAVKARGANFVINTGRGRTVMHAAGQGAKDPDIYREILLKTN